MDNKTEISFIGDIMCEKQQLLTAKIRSNEYDFEYSFIDFRKHIMNNVNHDYLVGNLETPLGYSNFTNEIYSFNSPYEFAK